MPQQQPPPPPASMVPPPCMELKESLVVTKAQGVFSKEAISIDSKFGPFVGEIITKEELNKKKKEIDFRYAWHVSDSKTRQILHVVDATEPEKGNWMRYVNSARFFEEQNIMSIQEGNEIYYKALKDIKPGEELLTWFGLDSKARRRKSKSVTTPTVEAKGLTDQNSAIPEAVGNGKRLRKKKVSEDMVPLDHDDVIFASSGHHHNRIRNNTSSSRRRTASVPVGKVTSGQKADAQKKKTQTNANKPTPLGRSVSCVQPAGRVLTSTSRHTVSTSQQTSDLVTSQLAQTAEKAQFSLFGSNSPLKGKKPPKTISQIVDFLKSKTNGSPDGSDGAASPPGDKSEVQRLATQRSKQRRSSLVGTAEYMEEHMSTNYQFLFEVMAAHRLNTDLPKSTPKRVRYGCDICDSKYRKALNLKRHVLREHLNHKYLSPEDITLLDHRTAKSAARVEADMDPDADDMSDATSDANNSPRVPSQGKEPEGMKKEGIKEEVMENVAAPSEEAEKAAAPSGEAEKAAAPSEEAEKATAPSEEAEKAAAPSGEVEKATAPSGEVEKATAPSGEVEKATAPSEEAEKAAAPSGEADKAAAPSGEVEKATVPSGEAEKATAPSGEVEKATAPSGEAEKATAPSGEAEKAAAPSGEAEKATAPSGEVKAAAPSGEVKAAAPSGEVKAAAPSGEVKAAAPSGEVKAAAPSGEVKAAAPSGEVKAAAPSGEVKAAAPSGEVKAAAPSGEADGAETPAEVRSLATGAEVKPKVSRAAVERELSSQAMAGKATFSYSGTEGVHDAFRCHMCVQLFPSAEKLKRHLTHDSHRSKGDKQFGCERCSQRFRYYNNYQRHMESHGSQISELSTACHICGKKFLNDANMRKHLRFHSGRNFPCKYGCDVVYPNVAELVKHLRSVHPDLPKRSQVTQMNVDGAPSGKPLQKTNGGLARKDSGSPTSNSPVLPGTQEVQFKTEEEAIQEFEASHPAGWTETRGRKPHKEATGLPCPICKKLFSTYGSMCRHRRTVHNMYKISGKYIKVPPPTSSTAPSPTAFEGEEENTSWEDPAVSKLMHIEANVEQMYSDIERQEAMRESLEDDCTFSPPPSPTTYYRDVADNIAENLSSYLDGGAEALKVAHQHIKADHYVPLDEAEGTQSLDFDWSKYNFPPFFQLVDPVIPIPPSPPAPAPSLRDSLLSLEADSSLAYPTRSAVAEREATRRESVGATGGQVLAERMPRRASVGSLDKQTKEGGKMTRRASVGSFDNQGTGTGVEMGSSGKALKEDGVENHQEDSAELKSTEQSSKDVEEVFDSQNNAGSAEALVSKSSLNPESDALSGTKCTETDEDAKQETDVALQTGDKNPNDDIKESDSHSTGSATPQNVGQSKDAHMETEVGPAVSPSHEASSAVSEQPDDVIGTVLPCESAESSSVGEREPSSVGEREPSSVGEREPIVDDSQDMSQCMEPSTGQIEASSSSDKQEDALIGQSTVMKTDTKQSDEMVSLSVSGGCSSPVDGQMENVGDKAAVIAKEEQPESAKELNSVQSEVSKDGGSKSDHSARTMMSKPADATATKCEEEEANNDLSEKELEYLSKGIILYVRKGEQKCPHVNDAAAVPARAPKNKDEEEYLTMLQLSVKKVKPQVTASPGETTNGETLDQGKTDDAAKVCTSSENNPVLDKTPKDHSETSSTANENRTVTSAVTPAIGSETSGQTHQDLNVGEQEPQAPKKDEHPETPGPASTEAVAVDKEVKSKVSADTDEEPDSDGELMEIHNRLQLQVLQERVAIDRETEEICRRCHPDNTEFGSPSKRTAKDFANMKFGRKHPVYSVCSLCRRYFTTVESLLRHQVKKHPSIQCSHFEVENGHGLEKLFYPEPSSRGLLAETVLLPPQHVSQESYTCTRCKLAVKQYSRLRAHILNCDPNTPTTPHTRRKRPKANRHRFMEKMLPDPGNNNGSKEGKSSQQSGAVRNLSFRPKSQGTVMGLRAKSFPSAARNYKLLHQGLGKKEEASGPSTSASASASAPMGRLPSTRVKTQNWKYSPTRFATTTTSSRPSTSTGKVGRPQRSRNHEMRYNPAAHVRRREKTECVDIHQCQGCRLSFRTLSLLERHTKNCSSKDKILGQTSAANKLLDGQDAKKHSCHYCPKRFKYLKGVSNHYANFCRVRAERESGGGLTAEDLTHEGQLNASLQQQEWNKTENRDHTDVIQGRACLHEDGSITHTRRKGGWPRGLKRSNKRRRNGWTYIKRHKADGNGSESASSSPAKSRSAPSPTSPVPASNSATLVAMSELEARLREPVEMELKRKHSDEELELPWEQQAMGQESKGVVKTAMASAQAEAETGHSKGKRSRVDDDLSQAPVIDRMDVAPAPLPAREGKQMSPDLEPPTLTPIPPLQDSLPNKRKRKPKRKSDSEMESKIKVMKEIKSAGLSTVDVAQPVLSAAGKKGDESLSTAAAVSAPVLSPQTMTRGLYVLEHVADASGSKTAQYKLVQLNIPTVTPRVHTENSGSDPPCPSSSSLSEQRPLPPNFLYPPQSESCEHSKEADRGEDCNNSKSAGEQGKSAALGKSQGSLEPTATKRRSRQRKKKSDEVSGSATTIKEMFKNRKSPPRKYPNTLKNMDAYRFEKVGVRGDSALLTAAAAAATSTSPAVSTALTSACHTPAMSGLPPGAGVAVLPPGAFLAVLPSPPVLLQSPPSSSTSLVKPATSTAAPIPLHTAMSEGKLLLLDPRSLPGLLAAGSLPMTSSPSPMPSPGKGAAKGQQPSPAKMPVFQVKSACAGDRSKAAEVPSQGKQEATSAPTATKPEDCVPNFLYDASGSSGTLTTGRPPQSSSMTNTAGENTTQQEGGGEALPKKTIDNGKGKTKKPKRGPPPSATSPNGSKVKTMTMMTSPGNHTLVSLSIPSTSAPPVQAEGDTEPVLSKKKISVVELPVKKNTDSNLNKAPSSNVASDPSKQEVLAEQNSNKSAAGKSAKKVTRATKRNKSVSPDKETPSDDKEDGKAAGDCEGSRVSDKKTVVLNVPVVQKRGAKRNTPATRNSAKTSDSAPANTGGRKRASALRKASIPAKAAGEKGSLALRSKRGSAAAAAVARGKAAAASSAASVAGGKRAAGTEEVISDDDIPLSAVAAKIKDN